LKFIYKNMYSSVGGTPNASPRRMLAIPLTHHPDECWQYLWRITPDECWQYLWRITPDECWQYLWRITSTRCIGYL